jgi:heme-degrading monooxygenase HmoA
MVWQMLRDMRAEAVRTKGYLYGETWRQVDKSRVVVVLSVWSSLEHWQKWIDDDYHKKMYERINRMLVRPPRVRILEDATEPINNLEPEVKEGPSGGPTPGESSVGRA